MGWVEDKFAEQATTAALIKGLWNSMRDSIGEVVAEFNTRTSNIVAPISSKDCKAFGQFCRRVEKTNGEFIEVFLDEENRSVNVKDEMPRPICEYGLDATRSRLEFFSVSPDDKRTVLSADLVSKMALEKFLFTPFPNFRT